MVSQSQWEDYSAGCAQQTGCYAWSPAMLKRYNVSVPRYTSYPGAQCFSEAFSGDDYQKALMATASADNSVGLYVHLPFCHDICYYCSCNKIVTRDRDKMREYLDALKAEIRMLAEYFPGEKAINALHFGGGTPTALSEGELTELVFELSRHFALQDKPERDFSIEVDPRTIDTDTLGLLKGLGFNRVSFGIQDFDPDVQKAINRFQSVEQAQRLVDAVRSYEFNSLNFDLIYGLPYQSEASIQRTLETVIGLGPDRIAFYNYAHLPERFPSQRAIDRHTLPGAEQKIAMLCTAAEILQRAGYRYIGMDHFVRQTDELYLAARQGRLERNFQGYAVSSTDTILGIGLSSISSLTDCYAQNAKTMSDYLATIARKELPYERGIQLTQDDKLRREIIQQIACKLRLDIDALQRDYGIDFRRYFASAIEGLEQAEGDGLLTMSDREILVSERGRLVLRNICALFDARAGDYTGRFSSAV